MTGLTAVLLLTLSTIIIADDLLDPRLATVRKAFLIAADDLGDDRVVATCVAERLSKSTPVQPVATREEADVILTVLKASVGKHPKAEITAALPDGTILWEGKSKRRGFNLIGLRNMTCPLADDLIGNLRKAMQKARDK